MGQHIPTAAFPVNSTETLSKLDSSNQQEAKELQHGYMHCEPKLEYPFLTLLVSGGHTILCICRGVADYEMLGGTLDDSVGESFDKAARLLGLPLTTHSGGYLVEQFAKRGDASAYAMPRPMTATKSCDFSYTGTLFFCTHMS